MADNGYIGLNEWDQEIYEQGAVAELEARYDTLVTALRDLLDDHWITKVAGPYLPKGTYDKLANLRRILEGENDAS